MTSSRKPRGKVPVHANVCKLINTSTLPPTKCACIGGWSSSRISSRYLFRKRCFVVILPWYGNIFNKSNSRLALSGMTTIPSLGLSANERECRCHRFFPLPFFCFALFALHVVQGYRCTAFPPQISGGNKQDLCLPIASAPELRRMEFLRATLTR